MTNLHLDGMTVRNPPYEYDLAFVAALAFHLLTTSKEGIMCDFWAHKVGLAPLLLSPDVAL